MRTLVAPADTVSDEEPQPTGRLATVSDVRQAARAAGMTADQTFDFLERAVGQPLATVRTSALSFAAQRDEALRITPAHASSDFATFDNPEFRAQAIGAALAARYDPGLQVPEHARQFMGASMDDIARAVLTYAGRSTAGGTRAGRIAAAMTTGDFPLILGEFTNRSMRKAYEAAPSALKRIAHEATAQDFRTIHRLQGGEFPSLEKVNEAGEYKHGSLGEGGESYKLATYGRIINLTRQAVINDDLSVFAEMNRRIGFAAAEFEARMLADLIISNPLMSDGVAVFDNSRGNLANTAVATTADAAGAISAARQKMRLQKGLDGETLINSAPKFVVVGADWETEMERTLASVAATKTQDVNPFSFLSLLVDARLTEHGMYLFADPNVLPVLEYAYLDGNRGPNVTTENGFDVDALRIKVSLDWGAGWLDFRGAYHDDLNG